MYHKLISMNSTTVRGGQQERVLGSQVGNTMDITYMPYQDSNKFIIKMLKGIDEWVPYEAS